MGVGLHGELCSKKGVRWKTFGVPYIFSGILRTMDKLHRVVLTVIRSIVNMYYGCSSGFIKCREKVALSAKVGRTNHIGWIGSMGTQRMDTQRMYHAFFYRINIKTHI